MKTESEVFEETLIELGFHGYKPSQMTNSDYWMCTTEAMKSFANQFKPKWISCVPEHKIPNGYYAFYLKHTTTGIEGVRLIELKNGENTSEVFHYGTHYCKIQLPEKPEL